ncbi:MAG: HAD family hydrolase [Acholeplasmatales bacterium]|jgi:Cof subfamily protein (haloacid dehalogenase superfamily)|nr:HAD family hydrolase [Acholeplasmatales bacterium]
MKYKLISSDYDRTLTNKEDKVPDENYDSIIKFIDNGGIFCINTGREKPSILSVYNNSPLRDYNMPLISHQGALVFLPNEDNRVLYKASLEIKDVVSITSYLDNLNCEYFIFTENNIIYNKMSKFLKFYIEILKIKTSLIEVDSFSKYFLENPDDTPMKINLKSDLSELHGIIDKVNAKFKQKFTYIGYDMAELVASNASKGRALEEICKYYNISLDETVSIGDSANDISMLETAALGVVVDNAYDGVKEHANIVIGDSSNASVSKLIEDIINNRL